MPLFDDYIKKIDRYKSDNNIDNKIKSLRDIHTAINKDNRLYNKDKSYLLEHFYKIYKSIIIQKLDVIKDRSFSEVNSYIKYFNDIFPEIKEDKILYNRDRLNIIEYFKKMYKSVIAQKIDDFITKLYIDDTSYPIGKMWNIVREFNIIYVMEDKNFPILKFKQKILKAYEKLLFIIIRKSKDILKDKLTDDQKKDLIVSDDSTLVDAYLKELIFNPNFSKEIAQEYPECVTTILQAIQYKEIPVLNPNLQECIKAEFGDNDINTILKVIANNQPFLIEVFRIYKKFKIDIKDKYYGLHVKIQALIVNNLNDIKIGILDLLFAKMEEVLKINLDSYNNDFKRFQNGYIKENDISYDRLSLNSHRQYINQLLEYIILNKEDSTLSLNDKYNFLIKYYYFDFLENTKNANNKEKLTFEKFRDIYKSTRLDKKHILDGLLLSGYSNPLQIDIKTTKSLFM